MSDKNERSVASDGSVEPVAWSIQWHGENRPDGYWTYEDKNTAEICLAGCGSKGVVVPLYRAPTLTDEEREEVRRAREELLSGISGYDNRFANERRRRADVLAGIIQRFG